MPRRLCHTLLPVLIAAVSAHGAPDATNAPLARRERPPVLQDVVDWQKPNGTLFLQNAYVGRDMQGVAPGSLARLLVLEETPRPVSGDPNAPGGFGNGSQNPLRILGEVPIEADGSAFFEAPALRSLVFTVVDRDGKAVKMMRSWASVMPGENLSCIGCHEYRAEAVAPAPQPFALTKPPAQPRLPEGVPPIIDFNRDIQPVLDRLCVSCHSPEKPAGHLDLSGHAGLSYTHGYSELLERGWVKANTYGFGRDKPYTSGTAVAKLLPLLDAGHHGARLSAAERELFRLWIDSGAFYSGTYGSIRQGRLTAGVAQIPGRRSESGPTLERLLAPEIFARRCDECHLPAKATRNNKLNPWPIKPYESVLTPGTRDAFFNLSEPTLSLILRAPLPRESGGLGLCLQAPAASRDPKAARPADAAPAPVFANTEDADYQKLLAGLTALADWHRRNPRFYQPNFVPAPEYVHHMKLYGILPSDWDSSRPLDPYATDERYYRSRWHLPPDAAAHSSPRAVPANK